LIDAISRAKAASCNVSLGTLGIKPRKNQWILRTGQPIHAKTGRSGLSTINSKLKANRGKDTDVKYFQHHWAQRTHSCDPWSLSAMVSASASVSPTSTTSSGYSLTSSFPTSNLLLFSSNFHSDAWLPASTHEIPSNKRAQPLTSPF
jgi:hypothetical protein